MGKIDVTYFQSPLGWIELGADGEGILYVSFKEGAPDEIAEINNSHLKQLLVELTEYFEGKRKEFEVQIKLDGTDFQNKVWKKLLMIPFGKTRTYLEQTLALGDAKAIRAVASANGKNKHAIIVPCHRVIGSNGSLTGYAGGMWSKKWLLEFEQKYSGQPTQQSLF